jgi:excisionase family DNA binding protein
MMTMNANTDELLTVAEVAAIVKVDKRTILRWIDAGKLPARRLPGRGRHGVLYRIARRDLEKFLSANDQEADHV